MLKPFADHFSRVAAEYASYRPRYPEALFAYLAGLPARRDLAWDCAAGSGQATLQLAPYFRRVVATDASPAQLAAAPAHPRVEYRVATAEASGLPPGSADLVTVAQALHWLDVAAFYAEADRVLAPGGAVAVWSYGLPELGDARLDRILATFYHDVIGPYWPPERRHVEAGYSTLPFPFQELPSPAFEMTAEWTLPDLLGYVGTWSATVRYREERGRDPVPPLGEELAAYWPSASGRGTIRWPLSLRAGRRAGA